MTTYDYNNFKKENQKINDLLYKLQSSTNKEDRKNLLKDLKKEVETLYKESEPGFFAFLKQSGSKVLDQAKEGYSNIKKQLLDLFTSSEDENIIVEKLKSTYKAFTDYIKGGEKYFDKSSMEKEDKTGDELEEEKEDK